eukprot:3486480-Heterocapsa_arctica.AAC.1
MLSTSDFESGARETMEPQVRGYYSSGGDDEITLRNNQLAKIAHADDEVGIVRAAAKADIIYMLSTMGSYTFDEMLAARSPGQQLLSQLYVDPERSPSEEYVQKLEEAGVKALFVT